MNGIQSFGFYLLTISIAWFSWDYVIDYGDQKLKERVMSVCTYTRTTDVPETACGNIQDKTNTEYICEANNKDVNTKCWVEIKKK